MFGRKKSGQLKKNYDMQLLMLIKGTKQSWDHLKTIQATIFDEDQELAAQTKVAEAKYYYLFKEARIRKIKSS